MCECRPFCEGERRTQKRGFEGECRCCSLCSAANGCCGLATSGESRGAQEAQNRRPETEIAREREQCCSTRKGWRCECRMLSFHAGPRTGPGIPDVCVECAAWLGWLFCCPLCLYDHLCEFGSCCRRRQVRHFWVLPLCAWHCKDG